MGSGAGKGSKYEAPCQGPTEVPKVADGPSMSKEDFEKLLEVTKERYGRTAARGELQFKEFLAWLLPEVGMKFDEECLKSLEEVPPPITFQVGCCWQSVPSLPCWYAQVDQTLVTPKLSLGRYFSGAVGHAGKVYCCPWDGEAFMIYDPKAEKIVSYDIFQVSPTRYARFSAICSFEGCIYAAPVVARILLVFDPVKEQLSGVDISTIADANAGHYKFSGICGLDGKIYAPPGSGSRLLIYDIKSGSVSGVDITSIAEGPAVKFAGACVCAGKIYSAPSKSEKMLVFDPKTGTLEGVDVTAWTTGPGKFSAVRSVGQQVFLCPDNADFLLRYDSDTGALAGFDVRRYTGGSISGKFGGMCVVAGRLYLSPSNASCVLSFSIEDEVFQAIDLSFLWTQPSERFRDICEVDGRLYLTGAFETSMLVLRNLDPWESSDVTQDMLSEAKMKRRDASLHLGVSLKYILEAFFVEALDAGEAANSLSFAQLAPRFAYGPNGLGYGQLCPRDGKVNCSIVDALRGRQYAGKATHFVSWCWGYSLQTMRGALDLWSSRHPELPKGTSLWICFFCNNQYRILEEEVQTGSDDLEHVFKSRLLSIGSALVLLDNALNPFYITRVWCIFETFMTIVHDVPTEMILPPDSNTELLSTIQEGITTVVAAFDAIDVASATASQPTDEHHVKELIQQTSSFDAVNTKVRDHLTTVVKDVIGNFLSKD